MANGIPGLHSSDASTRLAIYLSDHRAGSVTGLALARRLASNNRDNEFGATLSQVASEIAEDVDSLEELMNRLGANRDRVKERVAWTAEKLGRLKLNGQLLGYSPLSRLVELEGLSLGVAGKLALWNAVKDVFGHDRRLQGFDIERLIERAEAQRATLERCRLKSAGLAFGTVRAVPSARS